MKQDDGAPHPLDLELGFRIRERRRAVGLSQNRLAEALGVSFQQIQKYERGANRVSFSRLAAIATALNCTLDELTGGLIGGGAATEPHVRLLDTPGAVEALEAYAALGDKDLRRAVIDHMRALARVGRARQGDVAAIGVKNRA